MMGRDEDSPLGPHPARPKRLSRSQLESMGRDTIIELYFENDEYIRYLESTISASGSIEERQRLKNQILELTRRENMLVMKLTLKEQQTREFQNEIDNLKKRIIPQNSSQLRATLLDPAVNMLFEKMKKELDQTKQKLEETQNELSAWKFTPDSNTGKRLMAKCRLLYQENEDLGKVVSSGRVAKLESELALQRSFAQEMKQSQKDQDEFLLELDEEVEGMQSTIYFLQQQLKEANATIASLRGESTVEEENTEPDQMRWSGSPKAHCSETRSEQLKKRKRRKSEDDSTKKKTERKSEEGSEVSSIEEKPEERKTSSENPLEEALLSESAMSPAEKATETPPDEDLLKENRPSLSIQSVDDSQMSSAADEPVVEASGSSKKDGDSRKAKTEENPKDPSLGTEDIDSDSSSELPDEGDTRSGLRKLKIVEDTFEDDDDDDEHALKIDEPKHPEEDRPEHSGDRDAKKPPSSPEPSSRKVAEGDPKSSSSK